jgi:hypothetical protein
MHFWCFARQIEVLGLVASERCWCLDIRSPEGSDMDMYRKNDAGRPHKTSRQTDGLVQVGERDAWLTYCSVANTL